MSADPRSQPPPTLLGTGLRCAVEPAWAEQLLEVARAQCPDGFPYDETRELAPVRSRIAAEFVQRLAAELALGLQLPPQALREERFTVHGAGPVSLHDDARNYPDCYFVIVVAHSGRLGIVDERSRSRRHATGEVVLLDPARPHALVPEGLRAEDWRCAREPMFARDSQDQFLFLDFEVQRAFLDARFRRP